MSNNINYFNIAPYGKETMLVQALTTWTALAVLSVGTRLAVETSGTVIDQRARALLQRALQHLRDAEQDMYPPERRLHSAARGLATLEAARCLTSDLQLERLGACDVARLAKDLTTQSDRAQHLLVRPAATRATTTANQNTPPRPA